MASDSNPSSTNSSLRPLAYLESMDEVKVVFDRFDVNRDGLISFSELSNVLAALGSDAPADEVNRMIAEMDTDKDGFVNLKEFADFCSRKFEGDGPAGMKELRDAFQLYDEDQNGFISAVELHKVLNRLGECCTVEDCCKMIQYVDTDGDGNVSFDEFKKMMTYDARN